MSPPQFFSFFPGEVLFPAVRIYLISTGNPLPGFGQCPQIPAFEPAPGIWKNGWGSVYGAVLSGAEREKGEFTLTVRCPLTREYEGNIPMSWYDFQCLRVVTNLLSRTGDQLAEAVYYSWEGDNRYGVKLEQWRSRWKCLDFLSGCRRSGNLIPYARRFNDRRETE